MNNESKMELITAARCGDVRAMRYLLLNGVDQCEIFNTNETNDMESNKSGYSYMFIVCDLSCDYNRVDFATTDFKKAFDHAYKHSYELNVWVDGEDYALISSDINKGLWNTYSTFQNFINSGHDDLISIALPIIKEQKDRYEEEKRKEDEIRSKKLIEKELKELERLKTKYEMR